MTIRTRLVLGVGACALLVAGCDPPPSPKTSTSWKVVSHDETSGLWTIRRAEPGGGATVLTAICESAHAANYDIKGPTACNLQVGRTMVPNTETDSPGDYLAISQTADEITFSEGPENTRVVQRFRIRSTRPAA